MTKRHEALIPLTHDHHHALAQARRLSDLATNDDATERRNGANDFVNFYFGRAVRHFHEEEELFFPPLIDDPHSRGLVLRAVTDHLRLHGLVRGLKRQIAEGDVNQATMNEISQLLVEHVHFEEKELFPLVEEQIPQDQLMDLAVGGRRDV